SAQRHIRGGAYHVGSVVAARGCASGQHRGCGEARACWHAVEGVLHAQAETAATQDLNTPTGLLAIAGVLARRAAPRMIVQSGSASPCAWKRPAADARPFGSMRRHSR